MKTRNRKKRTPIPGLAEHIAAFSQSPAKKSLPAVAGVSRKAVYAEIRAAFADRVYAASTTIRKETT